MTKTVTLRLEEELHRELKIRMAQEGRTIQDYAVELIKRDMKQYIQKNQGSKK